MLHPDTFQSLCNEKITARLSNLKISKAKLSLRFLELVETDKCSLQDSCDDTGFSLEVFLRTAGCANSKRQRLDRFILEKDSIIIMGSGKIDVTMKYVDVRNCIAARAMY